MKTIKLQKIFKNKYEDNVQLEAVAYYDVFPDRLVLSDIEVKVKKSILEASFTQKNYYNATGNDISVEVLIDLISAIPRNYGYGTILMNGLLEVLNLLVEKLKQYNINLIITTICGELAKTHKDNGCWLSSLPFYMGLPHKDISEKYVLSIRLMNKANKVYTNWEDFYAKEDDGSFEYKLTPKTSYQTSNSSSHIQ